MPKEKIGEDVLGVAPPSRMSERKRRELESKFKEELKRLEEERKRKLEELGIRQDEKQKIRQLEEEGKLPKLPTPGELPHEKKLGETEIEPKKKKKTKKKVIVEEVW